MVTKSGSVMSVAIIIACALVLASPMLFFGYEAEAAAAKRVSGQGIGTVTCPNNSQQPGRTISFDASQSNGQTNGQWNIFIPPVFVNFKSGFITGGHIGAQAYSLTGNENSDTLCGAVVPVSITISGACGQGVTIQFTAANGERGIFTGNVVCS